MEVTSKVTLLLLNDEWREAFPVIRTLRKDLTESGFLASRDTMIGAGYNLFGLRHSGILVAVAGAVTYPHLTKGKHCWVHDLATLSGEQSKGHGQSLMRWMESWAKGQGCSRLCVHTRVDNFGAQKFYEQKLGYAKAAITYYCEL